MRFDSVYTGIQQAVVGSNPAQQANFLKAMEYKKINKKIYLFGYDDLKSAENDYRVQKFRLPNDADAYVNQDLICIKGYTAIIAKDKVSFGCQRNIPINDVKAAICQIETGTGPIEKRLCKINPKTDSVTRITAHTILEKSKTFYITATKKVLKKDEYKFRHVPINVLDENEFNVVWYNTFSLGKKDAVLEKLKNIMQIHELVHGK